MTLISSGKDCNSHYPYFLHVYLFGTLSYIDFSLPFLLWCTTRTNGLLFQFLGLAFREISALIFVVVVLIILFIYHSECPMDIYARDCVLD